MSMPVCRLRCRRQPRGYPCAHDSLDNQVLCLLRRLAFAINRDMGVRLLAGDPLIVHARARHYWKVHLIENLINLK
jgi:hypothetical protein